MERPDLIVGPDGLRRCSWCEPHDDYRQYHDSEWGVAPTGDLEWFEKVSLEGFQAGLSWLTILRRREHLREVFAGFDPHVVMTFGERKVGALLADPGVIRHEGKIRAAISNARCAVELIDECGTLSAFFERFREPVRPVPETLSDVPASTATSTLMSTELRRRGWRFVGPTTMYALAQSMGLVDDHLAGCWRRGAVS